MKKSRLIRLAMITIVGLAIAAIIASQQIKSEKTYSVVSKNFGGDFTLSNHLGETVTHKNFENQYRLIYFGFTYCPAICPTELQRISSILKNLGSDGEVIQPLFITVDPERDTIETMKNYVDLFHPRLIGLTGTPTQIDEIKKTYKIYATKVKDDTMTEYTMDHSSFIYFMGPDNSLIRIFKVDDSVEYMSNFIKKYMSI